MEVPKPIPAAALRQRDPPPPDHSKWKHKSLISSLSLSPLHSDDDADSVNAANSLSERLYQFGSRSLCRKMEGREGGKKEVIEGATFLPLSLPAKDASASDLPYMQEKD